ncbi:pirin family protein [Flavobacterium zepuense]|uniref:Pirin family protein n=1 Tax=Flavobacterium zepuense TaxID=2593302 RepID=A0A552V9T9_9FLAO|nr:pirin family protein [Flavobacterium zepuense]TRW27247.1 pirin family protein [Flavobacterium zepuense]
MKKKVIFSTKGQRADIGDITIYRILANRYANKVGSFVFLDHVAPKLQAQPNNNGTGAHPHRGIATLTYVIDGEVEHLDSIGNRQRVHSGGIQWMKAGNGIIHDESLSYDSKHESKLIHAFQFWINLPSDIKAQKPEYLAIQGNDVPVKEFDDNGGWLKVILGQYDGLASEIPNYLPQFLYHVHLEPGKQFVHEFDSNLEVAAFLPSQNITVNDTLFNAGEILLFDKENGSIEIRNTLTEAVDILLFGGEEYIETIVAEGPFVMNTQSGIAEAYKDFYAGKYGTIKINRQ